MEEEKINIYFLVIVLGALFIFFVLFLLGKIFSTIEYIYATRSNKPLFIHFYWPLRKLTPDQKQFISKRFSFYRQLNRRKQLFFDHRVSGFLKHKTFEGRSGFVITPEVELYVAATAIMLTFGMRRYKLPVLQKILIYPEIYRSTITKQDHKGEFNPLLKTMVLSWKDFLLGFEHRSDNVNLGIHEFIHVIQINSYKESSISGDIFIDASKEIINKLKTDSYRNYVLHSKFFRNYAFTNEFEFIAVLVEHFIESPQRLKQEFPDLYIKTGEMLNYRMIR
ncbi:zinc-dependent peptidase [Mesonia sp. HuA40]|uniref:zinc-dependent peptidase n=1 Tax=Mesonia sp. HuA40 TaxID=2602761 RepID=UPI001650A237|nr:zinc-dependent peptidase [Mesonia sp. HuA40]